MSMKLENKYEMMVILKPLLPDDVRKSTHKEILDLVEGQGGVVDDTDVWGKRYLAYDIEGHNEGYYIVYQLTMPGAGIAEMKRQLGLKQEVLRFMVVKIEKEAELGSSIKKKKVNLDGEDFEESTEEEEA